MGLGAAELDQLHALRSVFDERSDAIESALFETLASIPPLSERLGAPGVREFMHAVHRDYILSFTKRRFEGEEFVAPRRELGARLESLGIESHWVIRGYVVYFSLLAPVVTAALRDDADASSTLASLARRVALDVELVLDGYVGGQREAFATATDALTRQRRRLREDLTRGAEELREARAQAHLAGELASIGTLAAGLAHEIGTPMGVIQGHARILQQRPDAPDAAWRLQTIQDQITRISRIIRTLLGIASPQRRIHAALSLRPLIEESLEFVGERLREQGITVTLEMGRVRDVLGDGERLQQLLLNLLLNAADAMPKGGRLCVGLREDDGEALVSVTDDGLGIEPQHLDRVFEPFFTTKEAGEGNGLGLMMCKRIVAEHGGTIAVESAPGAGTCFTIRLPFA